MTHTLKINDLTLPCRTVDVDGFTYMVPRGIARNNRNRSWQLKVKRKGVLVLSGNFTDDTYSTTAGALVAAIEELAESGKVVTSKTLKINDLVTVSWATVGKGVVGLSANIYNPGTKKGLTIYLISQRKLAAGKDEGLKEKLVRALEKSWQYRNDRVTTPVSTLLEFQKRIDALLSSSEWQKFVEMGAE